MTATAWWTMLVICGLVWGGFLGLLARAMRSEGSKSSEGDGAEAR